MTLRRRLALWMLERLSFGDFEIYVEGLVARAALAPKEGEVVMESSRYDTLVSRLRDRHRRAFPHSLRDRMTVDEMMRDLDVVPILDEAGA